VNVKKEGQKGGSDSGKRRFVGPHGKTGSKKKGPKLERKRG